jgi:hypothetical protein
MIAWSDNRLKFTSGIGALCTTALLADVSHETIPVWLAIAVAMMPLLIFLFMKPDELPRRVVLPLQVFASLWYLLLAVVLSVLFLRLQERARGWPVYFIGLSVGAMPCVAILWRLLRSQKNQ